MVAAVIRSWIRIDVPLSSKRRKLNYWKRKRCSSIRGLKPPLLSIMHSWVYPPIHSSMTPPFMYTFINAETDRAEQEDLGLGPKQIQQSIEEGVEGWVVAEEGEVEGSIKGKSPIIPKQRLQEEPEANIEANKQRKQIANKCKITQTNPTTLSWHIGQSKQITKTIKKHIYPMISYLFLFFSYNQSLLL